MTMASSTLWLWTLWFCVPASTTIVAASLPSNRTVASRHLDLWDYLPRSWASFCSLDYELDPEVNATVQCRVPAKQKEIWRLADFRKALNPLMASNGLEVAVKIECDNGGTISLPFPFRAPGLVKLTVVHCRLLDKWADFNTPAQSLGDWLRVLDLRHCSWVNDPAMLQYVLMNSDKMDSHFECGQDSTLMIHISRNISQERLQPPSSHSPGASINQTDTNGLLELLLSQSAGGLNGSGIHNTSAGNASDIAALLQSFLNRSNADLGAGQNGTAPGWGGSGNSSFAGGTGNSTVDIAEDVLNTLINLDNVNAKCRFEQLEVMDESFSQDTSTSHFEFLVKDASFPKLRLLNESGIGMREIPVELRESRRKFPGSKLGVIDLSYNFIQDLGIIPMFPSGGIHTTLIVRNNNISTISLKMFQDLALVPDYSVDLEGNPINCDCDFRDFLLQLQNASLWEMPGMGYYRDHVQRLRCFTPAQLAGRTLDSVGVDELPCPVVPADLRPAMIVLIVVVIILVALLMLAVKYRKEVRILMYTRVHILLPCGLPNSPNGPSLEKTYDAFVAYAHQDRDWVLGSLLKHLEEPGGSPKGRQPCKLCIHERDFVAGKPIIDNIVDSIAASRHTIVILSNSFVRSGWAMEELEQAYHQSIEERKRHLVVVVLEDVPQEQMGAVLRRCTKIFTYLSVSDSFFWDRLLYSIQVADAGTKSKKRLPLKPTDVDDELDDISKKTGTGNVNKGYICDEKKEEMTPTAENVPSLPEDVKRAVFSDSMRTISVDSTLSETKVPVSPSQIRLERPLFESQTGQR